MKNYNEIGIEKWKMESEAGVGRERKGYSSQFIQRKMREITLGFAGSEIGERSRLLRIGYPYVHFRHSTEAIKKTFVCLDVTQ